MTLTRYQASDGFTELSIRDYEKDREEFPLLLRILLTPDYEIKELLRKRRESKTMKFTSERNSHPY